MDAPSSGGADPVSKSPETDGLTASDYALLWRLARQLQDCDSVEGAEALAAAAEAAGRNRPPALARAIIETVGPALCSIREMERLRNLAIRDPLTGLYNRRFLEAELTRRIAIGHPLALALLDLDRFRDFNERHGHRAGDAALQSTALLLERCRQGDDLACRYGGDEFVLVVANATARETLDRLAPMRAALATLSTSHDGTRMGPTPVTVSAGVAEFPRHGTTAPALVDAADGALYRAKSQGRDRTCFTAIRAPLE